MLSWSGNAPFVRETPSNSSKWLLGVSVFKKPFENCKKVKLRTLKCSRTICLRQVNWKSTVRSHLGFITYAAANFCLKMTTRSVVFHQILKALAKRIRKSTQVYKPELVDGLAMGGQTDSQVGSQVHRSRKKSYISHIYRWLARPFCH